MVNKYKWLLIVILIAANVIASWAFKSFWQAKQNIVYEYKSSTLNDFYFEGDYVVFDCLIKLKNATNKDLDFYMYANVTNEGNLVSEGTAIAFKKRTLEKEKFSIKANSEETYKVFFKAKKGTKNTKADRNPPKELKFEINK